MHIFFYKVNGKWLSLVEHLVWDQGVAGSNPVFPMKTYGALAQLGERLLCTQEVRSSILLGSIDDEVIKLCSLKTEY